ncbi:hypothetical protein IX84_27040 [Phaeodactylibacter xiamenensis]|uniref:Uncharacterized protein n=1 Tax=Phaeodactylibacter xiamenensis TaxID=1524460 RepID=A0A098S084_9BACT|nr:hypothetical protein IX84_27040 [Phaeodactylibacter xiamenensis]
MQVQPETAEVFELFKGVAVAVFHPKLYVVERLHKGGPDIMHPLSVQQAFTTVGYLSYRYFGLFQSN